MYPSTWTDERCTDAQCGAGHPPPATWAPRSGARLSSSDSQHVPVAFLNTAAWRRRGLRMLHSSQTGATPISRLPERLAVVRESSAMMISAALG